MLSRRTLTLSLSAALTLAAALPACSKSEPPTTETSPAPPASSPAPAASSVAPKEAAPSTNETATEDASDGEHAEAGAAHASATTHAADTHPTATTAKAAPTCGKKPLPPCPLQAWMKANAQPAVTSKDLPAMAKAFDKIVTFAPPGYTNWASIAKDGAKAARAGDMTAAKNACRSCHKQYKKKFKASDLRPKKI